MTAERRLYVDDTAVVVPSNNKTKNARFRIGLGIPQLRQESFTVPPDD
jgi:hypothetical protein